MSEDTSYYDVGDISVIDIIRAKLTEEQYRGFLLGNIIKYSLRINHKGQEKADSGKISEYSMWLNESYYKVFEENQND